MSNDAFHTMVEESFNQHVPELPYSNTPQFYNFFDGLQLPFWDGCTNHFDLSVAFRLTGIKSQLNMS